MRHYEIIALVHPNQGDQIHEIIDRYREIVEDSGGTVHRCENLGRRKLAYPIRKLLKAGYFLMNIECESAIKDEIENLFRYNDSIIRSLIIRMNKAVTKDSPLLIKKKQLEAEEAAEAELERKRAEEIAAKEAALTAEAEIAENNSNTSAELRLEAETEDQSKVSVVTVPESVTDKPPEIAEDTSIEAASTEPVHTDNSEDSTDVNEVSTEEANADSSDEENPEAREPSSETSSSDEFEDTHNSEQAVGETNETTK